jgi:pimeloyl-ACP methyl ester carboxylesterase
VILLRTALACAAAVALGVTLWRPLTILDALVRGRLRLAGLRSKWENVAGLRLHWLERPGDDPPALLLHGLGADAERWFPILPGLLAGRRLLVPSLPAHGRSQAPASPFGVADLTRWLDEWLGRQVGSSAVDVIGFSLGGWVAMRLALLDPRRTRRLVLVSSAGIRFDPPPPRAWLLPKCLEDVRGLIGALTARPLRLPRFVLRDLLRRARPERRWLVESLLEGEGLVDGELASLRVPTLVVWGARDRIIPPVACRRLASGIPGSRARELTGCGHLPYWERRRELAKLLEEFLG